jgi:hypothetical protein
MTNMKKIITLVLFCIAASLQAQVANEFRIQTAFLGKTDGGLRRFFMAVETNNAGTWKMISKAGITTGRNFQLAEITPDSTVAGLPFRELLKDKDFNRLYEMSLNELMDRIDAPDQNAINTPMNDTEHKLFRDAQTQNIVVSIKAGEKDKEAIIRVFTFDNTKLILLNKVLKPFSGNVIEIGTTSFSPGNYIVLVTTPTQRFSEKFLIY